MFLCHAGTFSFATFHALERRFDVIHLCIGSMPRFMHWPLLDESVAFRDGLTWWPTANGK